MKHSRCASSCSSAAFASMLSSVTVTRGWSVTSVKAALPLAVHPHHAAGGVLVRADHNAGPGALGQVAEHVAFGECGDQQLLGVPALALTTKSRIGGAFDGQRPVRPYLVLTAVTPVGLGARTPVAGPDQLDRIAVFSRHQAPPI